MQPIELRPYRYAGGGMRMGIVYWARDRRCGRLPFCVPGRHTEPFQASVSRDAPPTNVNVSEDLCEVQ